MTMGQLFSFWGIVERYFKFPFKWNGPLWDVSQGKGDNELQLHPNSSNTDGSFTIANSNLKCNCVVTCIAWSCLCFTSFCVFSHGPMLGLILTKFLILILIRNRFRVPSKFFRQLKKTNIQSNFLILPWNCMLCVLIRIASSRRF